MGELYTAVWVPVRPTPLHGRLPLNPCQPASSSRLLPTPKQLPKLWSLVHTGKDSLLTCAAATAALAVGLQGRFLKTMHHRVKHSSSVRGHSSTTCRAKLQTLLDREVIPTAKDVSEKLRRRMVGGKVQKTWEAGNPAKTGAQRCVGNVKHWSKRKKKGIINYGAEQVVFTTRDCPPEILQSYQNTIPEGIPVEFDLEITNEGDMFAHELQFPCATTFQELGLTEKVIAGAANALGLNPLEHHDALSLITPAPVQVETIPKILNGQDLVIAAETGSGKSLAYMLPLVQEVCKGERKRSLNYGLDYRYGEPLALVICPMRELALQAAKTLKLICKSAKLRVRCVSGGQGTYVRQRRELEGIVDVLVATPDRLLKFYRDNDVRFNSVSHMVIDEADFMLTQGFADLHELLHEVGNASKVEQIRYTLVTASITKPLWKAFQQDKRWQDLRVLESKSLHKPQANCHHSFLKTKGRDRVELLVSLIRPEIVGRVESRQTLVFCNTISTCRSLHYHLQEAFNESGASQFIGAFHKEMRCEDRDEILFAFTRGDFKVLICSDIAQRGLDLPNCGHIINYDFPMNSIDYLHRAGRTARFGEPGRVTSLVQKGDKVLARAVELSCGLGAPIDKLSTDKRDYLRGGALGYLLEKQTRQMRNGQAKATTRPYDGSLR